MNTTFSFNRLGLLINRYFAENKQRELSFWGIVIVVFIFMHKINAVESFFYISGFIFAARMFKVFSYTPGGMHYLLIPATHLEKLVTAILLSTVYFFIMLLVSYTIGNIAGTSLENLIFSTQNPVSLDILQLESASYAWGNHQMAHYAGLPVIFFTFAIFQSVFLLGSVYFKRHALIRTLLTIIFIFILIAFLEALIFRITYGSFSLVGHSFNFTFSGDDLFPGFEQASKVFSYLLVPFFWLVAYFRLTEKQV
jgi:hypothetical protein